MIAAKASGRSEQGPLQGGVEERVAAPAFPLFSSLPSRNEASSPALHALLPTPLKSPEPGEVLAQAVALAVRAEGEKDGGREKPPKPWTHKLKGNWKFSQFQTGWQMLLGGLGNLCK